MADWKMPAWMEPYRSLIELPFYATQVEIQMNCPEHMKGQMSEGVVLQVDMLTRLYESGLLLPPEGR